MFPRPQPGHYALFAWTDPRGGWNDFQGVYTLRSQAVERAQILVADQGAFGWHVVDMRDWMIVLKSKKLPR